MDESEKRVRTILKSITKIMLDSDLSFDESVCIPISFCVLSIKSIILVDREHGQKAISLLKSKIQEIEAENES